MSTAGNTVETVEGIDIAEVYRASNIDEVLLNLDAELIGLHAVKGRIRDIASLLLIAQLRERVGLTTLRPTLHMSFTGRPGTGKTTVATRLAAILHKLGYLRKGHVVVTSRDDLVGQYVGHTAPKTREVIRRAMGGVLFIDEAYYLYRPENERDYGPEAIEVLLQSMENERDDVVVVLAGYKDRMETFFQSNPGFHSRIAHHIDFPDYSAEELMSIAELMLTKQGYSFDETSRATFREYLKIRIPQPHFANARSVRNALDRAKLRQATRLVQSGGIVDAHELARLDSDDIAQSRIFSEQRNSSTLSARAG